MANALNINSLTDKSQRTQTNQINRALGEYGNFNVNSNTVNNKNSKPYDYSAIKLSDDDKLYRLKIKKQSDSLLSAAETITNKFPPLFNQMVKSYNGVQNEINNRINEKIEKEEAAEKEKETNARLDVEGISNTISDFIRNFNEMRDAAQESKSYTAQSTVNRMTAAFEDSKDLLSEIGITSDEESDSLKIDRDKLEEAVKNGHAEEVLTAENGFPEKSARIAFDSAENSDKFIDKVKANIKSRPHKNTNVNYNYLTNPSIDN